MAVSSVFIEKKHKHNNSHSIEKDCEYAIKKSIPKQSQFFLWCYNEDSRGLVSSSPSPPPSFPEKIESSVLTQNSTEIGSCVVLRFERFHAEV